MKSIMFILTIIMATNTSAIETLKYDVLSKDKNIEIRRYKSYIAASVSYDTEEEFKRKAFRALADYIFGNNISMTSPVLTKGEKIGMTAPVLSNQKNKLWTMTFSMPSNYTIDTLPTPKNKRIKIKEIKEKNMAAIRFSGFMSDSNFNINQKKLIKWLESNNVEYSNDFARAGYNPPWTLPFFRRNEVLITLD